ncbi:MAG TPA: fructose-1,6-bisphosphate aldolase/phosphatase [Methanoculleus sp.]|jgi:fructose 1,6-bisphosphate aldolase/phosphatase|uniref:fructose-1,6-bisphosphate aldolase/phosphatase n=1 Tax=Methanoculleus sp. TaxID=90427 RepID=UPI000B2CA5DE|nr:fructose-1,6-bisphosphate aldolase/phosphatase [Methanoculleus sp.]MBP7144904.1 fructose 1,6-bisphosphatase [Methanoculleus sp.]HNQ32314.1 fructose-1,6-bisphosphate aldolase/phosphatase [Methanoculleus sp.]HNT07709.1 fructose-1,6-bisphosphate aldolase/phosphatase [Methanoculleus sp.]HNV37865.1 fructose-1,6-bisphosphate aldolase/phosphatase [Methanoculleus sp.]HOC83921.1 fructose-1,6-bisphosphate aldolase/phosphatase [Methanoculleus sp.]
MVKTTVSVIKADVGSFPGHSRTHPKLLEVAARRLKEAEGSTIIDSYVTHCGDDLELIMTHTKGEDNEEIHKLAWDIFMECAELAKEMKLYGAGQDLLADAFSGNVKGMGPGVAEMEFEERGSDPVLVFMADKTEPGAWNYFLYKIFADPFSTSGLVIDPSMHQGFTFEVHDVMEKRRILFNTPEESYSLLAYIGAPSRYVIKYVRKKDGTVGASTSTQRLNLMAGRYVGKDDPVMVVRAQSGFPAVGEVIDPFRTPILVAGWMRGSHHGPFMPVGVGDANCTAFDGPPRVICLGFQVNNGKLIGPADMFDDPAFDRVRDRCCELSDVLRAHGPFEPHRLSLEEMEYTTLPGVEKQFKDRWEDLPE